MSTKTELLYETAKYRSERSLLEGNVVQEQFSGHSLEIFALKKRLNENG
jgi:hypothetical protein